MHDLCVHAYHICIAKCPAYLENRFSCSAYAMKMFSVLSSVLMIMFRETTTPIEECGGSVVVLDLRLRPTETL